MAPATTSGLRAGRGSVEPIRVAWSDRGDRKNAGGIGNDWALLVFWTKVVGKQANWIGWCGAMQGFHRELPETAVIYQLKRTVWPVSVFLTVG